jgi:hypothetical protein
MSTHKLWIDPPEGWRYGFPAVWDKEEYPNIKEFLLEKGYPDKDIDFAMKYIRCWEHVEERTVE